MTENRKPEDTVCPTFYAALLQKFTVNQSGKVGEFKLFISEDAEEAIQELAQCLGLGCQMFNANFRGCGLRFK